MADKEKDTAVERVILLDHAEMARRDAERKLAEPPVQLDKTKPGGVYQAPDGRFHDAHGREVTEDGELVSENNWEMPPASTAQVGGPDVTDAAREGEGDEEGAWREDMKDQRRESIANPVEGAPLLGDTVLPPLEEEVEEVDESTGTKRKVKRRRSK